MERLVLMDCRESRAKLEHREMLAKQVQMDFLVQQVLGALLASGMGRTCVPMPAPVP